MKRAGFTVFFKGRTHGMSANHLSITQKAVYAIDEDGKEVQAGMVSMLNFISSGEMNSVESSKVARIEWNETGLTYCSECDEPLRAVGAGIHSEDGYTRWLKTEVEGTFTDLTSE